jgi:hypothetical protein
LVVNRESVKRTSAAISSKIKDKTGEAGDEDEKTL